MADVEIIDLTPKVAAGTQLLEVQDAGGGAGSSGSIDISDILALAPAGGINQLTGDVTAGPGTGSQAATIAALAVTTGKIANAAVTFAKMLAASASTLIGRRSGSGGDFEAVTLGVNLSMSAGGVLDAASAPASTITVNPQSGTTYAFQSSDQGKLVVFSNAGNVASTIAQATGSFGNGYYVYAMNTGGGTVTITPTTSTIGKATSYKLKNGNAVMIVSDGTNYQTIPVAGFTIGVNGGFSISQPDGATSGGNARGDNAMDLQADRNANTQVASGGGAHIGGGRRNTASGLYATVVGGDSNTASGESAVVGGSGNQATTLYAAAFNQSNTASGLQSFAAGQANTVSGQRSAIFGYSSSLSGVAAFSAGQFHTVTGSYSAVFGAFGSTQGADACFVFAGGVPGTTTAGAAQKRITVLQNRTSGATAQRLTSDGAAASTTNIGNLANNMSSAFRATITIRDLVTGNTNTYDVALSLITRGANAAATAMSAGNPAVVAGPTTGTALTLAAAPTITADTTNGGFNVSYTPPVGNTNAIQATCVIEMYEAHG